MIELICTYDHVRLTAYQKVQAGIYFFENDTIFAQCFIGLDYFNYAYKKDNASFSRAEVELLRNFYKGHHLNSFKFFSDQPEPILIELGAKVKGTFVKQTYVSREPLEPFGGSNFKKVDETTINEFTRIYLDSFEAGPKNLEEVSRNFKQLLNVSTIELFLIQEGNVSVGVLVVFIEGQRALLAGGAVLPAYRHSYHHKNGIAFRINKLLNLSQVKSIETWTYEGSQSYLNMLSCGFVNNNYFRLYALD